MGKVVKTFLKISDPLDFSGRQKREDASKQEEQANARADAQQRIADNKEAARSREARANADRATKAKARAATTKRRDRIARETNPGRGVTIAGSRSAPQTRGGVSIQ